MCYYFDDIIKLQDFDLDILIQKELQENILIFGISNKILIESKPFWNIFNKIDKNEWIC